MPIDWSKPIELETGEPLCYIGPFQGAGSEQLHVVAVTPIGLKQEVLYSFHNDGKPFSHRYRAVNREPQEEQEPVRLLTEALSQMAYKWIRTELLDKLSEIRTLDPHDTFDIDYHLNIQVKVLQACLKQPDIITALFDE